MSPKGPQNGLKMESKNAHIFKPFRAAIRSLFWHLLGTQNGANSRHNNMAKTKVRTTCGNSKMMEKRWKNNIFEQFCNPGGRQKLAKRKQKRRSENKTETVHVLDAFWHTLGHGKWNNWQQIPKNHCRQTRLKPLASRGRAAF